MKAALQPFIAILRAKGFFGKSGQTLVEYALVLAVMTVVLVASTMLLSGRIQLLFSMLNDIMDSEQADTSVN